MFELHPTLAKDTVPVASLKLCRALLMNDARYPWMILVPARAGVREIHELAAEDQVQLLKEIVKTSMVLETLFAPDKINVGTLGNLVPQLHVHVIARFEDDPAWPGPVWGHGEAEAYAADRLEAMRGELAGTFSERT